MTEPIVGDIVHLLHAGTCYAAIITEVSATSGTALHVFHPPTAPDVADDYHPYVSLSSARPTSGWHWIEEHE